MWMHMLNLIKLQHARGASIPDCVIYSKYAAKKYTCVICTKSPHVRSMFTFLQNVSPRTVCFTRFIELAVKQVQFEHVNTGSFLFSWLWRWTGWCGGKKYRKIRPCFFSLPNSGHAKQNLQGAYQIMKAPSKSSPSSEEPFGVILVLEFPIHGCGRFFQRRSASDLFIAYTTVLYPQTQPIFPIFWMKHQTEDCSPQKMTQLLKH